MVETTDTQAKIGAEVSEAVYNDFKKFVFEATGKKRGVLGEAVEAALVEYMDDGADDDDDDVSNADLMREIKALRQSDSTSPHHHTPDEGTVSDDDADDDTDDDDGKPEVSAPIGERVSWLASEIDIQGRVAFSTLVDEVGRQYDVHGTSKCRELAWEWAARRAPTRGEYPAESEYKGESRLDKPERDGKLQSRASAEDRRGLFFWPRRHESGAWFIIDNARSDAALNHQAPTQRGDVHVYLGSMGARECAADMELLEPGVAPGHDEDLGVVSSESSDEGESGSGDLRSRVSRDSDESTESAESAESDDESDALTFDDLADADRGRE